MSERTFVSKNNISRDRDTNREKSDKVVFVNQAIKAPTIVVLDEDKNNLWSFPRRVALEMAEEKWLDLIQMHYDPIKQVCTAIITDYGKYMYRKQKDNKEKKKNQKQRVMKELKISYAIWENDLQLKIKKAKEFLQEWNNVRFVIKLKWREKIYEDKAVDKLKSIVVALEEDWRPQFPEPKKEMSGYSIVLFSKV